MAQLTREMMLDYLQRQWDYWKSHEHPVYVGELADTDEHAHENAIVTGACEALTQAMAFLKSDGAHGDTAAGNPILHKPEDTDGEADTTRSS